MIAAVSRRAPGEPALGGQRPEVRVWQAVSGNNLFSLPVAADSVAFSPDSATLAVAVEGAVEMYEVSGQKRLRSLPTSKAFLRSVAYSADGRYLASGAFDGIVKVWDLTAEPEKAEELSLEGSGMVVCLAFSADGQRLAAGNASGGIDLWNLKALRAKDLSAPTRLTLFGHTGQVRSVAFHPGQPLLASGANDRTIRLWDTETGRESHTLRGHEEEVTGVLFGPGGKQLLSASRDGMVKFWDPSVGQEAHGYLGQTFAARGPAQLATTALARPGPLSEGAKSVWLWDRAAGKQDGAFDGHQGAISAVAFSHDGKIAASGAGTLGRGETIVWEVANRKVIWTLKSEAGGIRRIAFDPHGRLLATASEGDSLHETKGEVKLWDLKMGQLVLTVAIQSDRPPSSLAFGAEGKVLAVATSSGPVRLLDTRTGQEVLILKDHAYTSAAFSADGKWLIATGQSDLGRGKSGKAWVYAAATGELAYELTGHSDEMSSAAFSDDGARIATGGADGTLRIWDVQTRQEILSLPQAGIVNQVQFAGDDLVSSSGDFFRAGFTKVWKGARHEK
jgi:WD40 repeat protein